MNRGRGISGVFQHRFKPLPWPLIFIFLLLTIIIVVSGYFYYQKQKKNVILEQTIQLQAIADLKAADIQHWLGERMGDARSIAENRILTTELLAFLRDRSAGPRQESIRGWMETLRSSYHYQNILLLDGSGEVLLALDGLYPVIGSEGLELMEAVRRRKKAVISDLHRSEKVSFLHMDVAAPLLAADTVAGFVFLRIDPAQYLYPMIQSWPTPSPSAETLLVRREGDDVLYLNELRHSKNTALKLRFPIRSPELPAAQAVLGKTGAVSGRDYRGIAVWSVLKPVPDSNWIIVAKVDREEIEWPLRRSALAIFLVALSLVLAAAMLILFLWQRQNARFHLRQLEAESQKQALVLHFDYLTRYANDIILLSDEEGNILEANERALVTYGYGQKALLKMNLRDLRVPEEQDNLAGQMRRAQEKLGLIFETTHQKKDGTVFPVEVSARAIAVDTKKYFQSIVRDITERKQAEQALRESEDKFKYVFDNSVIGKSITLPNGEINVNKAFCDMLGYSAAELKARKWQELTPPDDIERTQKALDAILSGEKDSVRFEKRYIHKNGSIVWADVGTTLRRDAAGKPLYFMTAIIDITERIRAEVEIRHLNEELEQRVLQRTAQLEAANKELEAFSYSVSHDLRAPLRAIDGFSRIVLEEYAPKLDNEGKRLLDVIAANTHKMGQLIDDLLAFSRLNRQQMAFTTVDLAALADTVFSELKNMEKGRKIELEIGALPAALGDRSMLRQVLQNLLANAIKFTRPRTKARIKFGGQAAIAETIYYVKDNGVGFDMEYAHKLFGVFQRLHGSDKFEGTGVGLAIVQRIVLRHGGRVWAESTAKGGATFYFSLPTETASETAPGEDEPVAAKGVK